MKILWGIVESEAFHNVLNISETPLVLRIRENTDFSTHSMKYTVDSRYLEVEGIRWNTSRYPYFDISDVQNWGKYQTNNQISQMNM